MWRAVLALALWASAGGAGGARYGFYRSMEGARRAGGARRVFGGAAAALRAFPPACALLDRYWTARCSAAALTPSWVLTAAHCVTPQVAYVKYNTRRPYAPEGGLCAVSYLYRHPSYKVLQQDEGLGMDVTVLHHDVGLLRTRTAMQLSSPPALPPDASLRLYDLEQLHGEEVQVLGYGRTDTAPLGEELFEVRLRLVGCERREWRHCVCGQGAGGGAGGARGVCSGDSGGPVLFRGAQVGVTSMGPMECAAGLPDSLEGATSVFTSLFAYADLVNDTIHNTESTLRMRRMSASARRPRVSWPALAAGAVLLAHPTR